MPNWVRNKIFTKEEELWKLIKSHVSKNESDEELFDFNSVIKMPEELDIPFSSNSDKALLLYVTKISPHCLFYGNKKDKLSENEFTTLENKLRKRVIVNFNFEQKEEELVEILNHFGSKTEEALMIGKKQIDNLEKYNAINWYEWRVQHWGTKWNSSNLVINKKSISFDTPWSPVIPLIKELSKQHKNIKFFYLYADEDIGSNTGFMCLNNGKIEYEGVFENNSKEAYQLALDLWDCEDNLTYDDLSKLCKPMFVNEM